MIVATNSETQEKVNVSVQGEMLVVAKEIAAAVYYARKYMLDQGVPEDIIQTFLQQIILPNDDYWEVVTPDSF